MMNNQREIDRQDRLPAHIESPGTNKDNLFNGLITLFDKKKGSFGIMEAERLVKMAFLLCVIP